MRQFPQYSAQYIRKCKLDSFPCQGKTYHPFHNRGALPSAVTQFAGQPWVTNHATTKAYNCKHSVWCEEAECWYCYAHKRSAQGQSVLRLVFMVVVGIECCDSCLGGDTKLESVSPDVGILVSEYCDRFLQFSSHTSVKRVLNRGTNHQRPPCRTNPRNKESYRSLLLITLRNVPYGLLHIPFSILSNRHVQQCW